MRQEFEVRLRLREIAGKLAELSAATSMLDDMVLQLDRLRAQTGGGANQPRPIQNRIPSSRGGS